MMTITREYLMKATGSNAANAEKFLEPINETLNRFDINTNQRVAAFLATVAIESGHLTAVEEGLFYSNPERLASIFKRAFKSVEEATPYAKNPKGLSQKLYEGFHGRGLIQLTWERNYKAAGDALGVDFVANPEKLAEPLYAALSAGWFWKANGCNEAADQGDMDKVTRIVNGPAKLHLKERVAQYDVALAAATVNT